MTGARIPSKQKFCVLAGPQSKASLIEMSNRKIATEHALSQAKNSVQIVISPQKIQFGNLFFANSARTRRSAGYSALSRYEHYRLTTVIRREILPLQRQAVSPAGNKKDRPGSNVPAGLSCPFCFSALAPKGWGCAFPCFPVWATGQDSASVCGDRTCHLRQTGFLFHLHHTVSNADVRLNVLRRARQIGRASCRERV